MKSLLPLVMGISLLMFQDSTAQISIKNYKQPEEQTFYVSTDTTSQKFKAKTLKKPIKTKPMLYYTWYKYNQVFISQGGYDGRLVDGDYICSFKNNNLKTKGTYKNGLRTSLWSEWNIDGQLKETSIWKNGQKNGLRLYYDKGLLVKSENYNNDLLNGKSIVYKDSHKEIAYYKNGVLRSAKTLQGASFKTNTSDSTARMKPAAPVTKNDPGNKAPLPAKQNKTSPALTPKQ